MSATEILSLYEKETGSDVISDDFPDFLSALHPDDANAEFDPENEHFEE